MTTAIKRRRGTTVQHATFTGLEGELTIDTTKDTVVVHDGATAGGFPLAKESQATTNVAITGGTISGITDLAVADGGTGASTAANARTNLGVTATGTDTAYAYRANNLSDLASASTARSNLGLGTIATQAASSVAVTGGTINGTVIGGTTRAAGSFTTVTTTNDASISGLTVGKGGGSVSTNAVFGRVAGNSNTTGNSNVFVGDATSYSNTTGSAIVSVGKDALYNNTTGGSNTALGYASLFSNTTASNNTAVGYQAGYSNTTGTDLIAIGYQTLYANTTGSGNVGIGRSALGANTTGYSNTAVGTRDTTNGVSGALQNNTTGAANSAFGVGSLASNTTASNNTAVGYQAGYSGTTGDNNTVFGYQAGYGITTGYRNVLIGASAGTTITTGQWNTCIGPYSGNAITSGTRNSILGGYNGNQGGLDIRTASNNIVLSDGDGNPRQVIDGSGNLYSGCVAQPSNTVNGFYAGNGGTGILQSAPSANANFVLYKPTSASQSAFQLFLTNNALAGSITQNGATGVLYNTASDYRFKNITGSVTAEQAKDFIMALKPRQGTWKADGSKFVGFVAHEFQEVSSSSVNGKKDEVDADGNPIMQSMQASSPEVMANLIALVQDLTSKLEAQALEIAQLKGL